MSGEKDGGPAVSGGKDGGPAVSGGKGRRASSEWEKGTVGQQSPRGFGERGPKFDVGSVTGGMEWVRGRGCGGVCDGKTSDRRHH